MIYIITLLIIAADQLSKYLYVAYGAPTVPLIPGVLELFYVENKGAAWGIFGNHQLILYVFSALVTLCLCAYFVWKRKSMTKLLRTALALVIAGAVGNLIDRFALGYVRDMIYIKLIDFPVFNIADSAITIGGVLLFIDLIFPNKGKETKKSEDAPADKKESAGEKDEAEDIPSDETEPDTDRAEGSVSDGND